MLTAQPQAGRDAASLAAAAVRDTALLERGTKMRTLYQHSARRSAMTHEYVAAVTERGAEVRTLDEFFNRLIVIDRRVAVIPGAGATAIAVAVREPSVVAYLVDIFERAWERARPFTNRESACCKDIAAEQRAMTIRMLIEGHSDPVSAKRLGVSPRTYAGYVADLKEEYEAETRFQLGYTMGQLGITGSRATCTPTPLTAELTGDVTRAATESHCPSWIESGRGDGTGTEQVGGELGPRLDQAWCLSGMSAGAGAASPQVLSAWPEPRSPEGRCSSSR